MNGHTVVVMGEIDATTTEGLRAVLREAEHRAGERIVDLRRVTFFDSTALQLLGAAAVDADRNGAHLTVRTDHPTIRRSFALMRLNDVVTLDPPFAAVERRVSGRPGRGLRLVQDDGSDRRSGG